MMRGAKALALRFFLPKGLGKRSYRFAPYTTFPTGVEAAITGHGFTKRSTSLLYGAGLRLMECLRLRVKDVEFAYQQLMVRNGKGEQDRITMKSVQESLKRHLATVELLGRRGGRLWVGSPPMSASRPPRLKPA
jgi:integrase